MIGWDNHCAEHVAKTLPFDLWASVGECPRNWREAAELYRKHGVTTMAELVTKVLGEPVDPKLAHRGDIVMVDGALGVCRGELVECLDRMQPLSRATLAWRVRR